MASSPIGPCHFLLLFVPVLYASCSASYAQRSEDSTFDRKETRGNVTFGCNNPGPCIPCSSVEKNEDETYHCSISGYRQSYKCTEIALGGLKGHLLGSRKLTSIRKLTDIIHEEKATIHDEHKLVRLYFTCLPTDTDEKLTVWGFENPGNATCAPTDPNILKAIMLALLGISAPVIYYRRKRNIATAGMTRLPTSARF